jgi:hypothetical protein
MSAYDSLPIFDLSLFPAGRMRIIGSGGGLEGGRNGADEPQTINLGAGGRLKIAYTIDIFTPDQHGYANQIEARMSSGFRFINVPIMWEWHGPFPVGSDGYPIGRYTDMFDPDASLIDVATSSIPTVTATVYEAAAQHAGQIKIQLAGAVGTIHNSLWFSIDHGTQKGHRAYRTWEHTSLGSNVYLVSLDRPLRRPVTVGQAVRIYRPYCVMKYESGMETGWDVAPFWRSQATFNFIEAP